MPQKTNTTLMFGFHHENAKIMVENIYQSLVQVDPANKDYYKANKDKYLQELDNSDKNINETLSGEKNQENTGLSSCMGLFMQRLWPYSNIN